ncbi:MULTISPECIES: DUF2795 domain-containing protein [unclassified Haladaptatus]|uniref:DUF5789 family protein n=1 Tax=unclassified Haladaptatus TaxID=2622732 RepID=UPI0023E8DD79|nr:MULTISPECIES: DUF2795 domain-containing protein [unclassified Haladaptatus]
MRLNNGASELIEAHNYPATSGEFVEQYGEEEIKLANGSETFGEVFGLYESDETFTDAEDAKLAAFQAVSHKGVGRRFYSDRESFDIAEKSPEAVSF